jgi:hypothetical protein
MHRHWDFRPAQISIQKFCTVPITHSLTLCWFRIMVKSASMNTHLYSLAQGLQRSLRKDATTGGERQIVLRSNDHWKLPSPSVSPIRCVSGTVWITCEGQREDVVLTAGHEWQPERRGLTVVGALSDAVLCMAA